MPLGDTKNETYPMLIVVTAGRHLSFVVSLLAFLPAAAPTSCSGKWPVI